MSQIVLKISKGETVLIGNALVQFRGSRLVVNAPREIVVLRPALLEKLMPGFGVLSLDKQRTMIDARVRVDEGHLRSVDEDERICATDRGTQDADARCA